MRNNPAVKGMTLIEVMISIAILAIVIAIGSKNISSYQWMNKEIYYSSALRQGERLKSNIEGASFDSLPPEVLVIPENGILKLSNKFVDEDSISIFIISQNYKELSSHSYTFNPLTSEIQISKEQSGIPYRGEKALVSYAFLMPDSPEPVLVPETEPYRVELFNSPIQEVIKVELVEANKLTTISPSQYTYFRGTGIIEADKKYAGKILAVSYIGGNIQNRCSGLFMDQNSNLSLIPSDMKLIKIQEIYGANNEVELGILKVKK